LFQDVSPFIGFDIGSKWLKECKVQVEELQEKNFIWPNVSLYENSITFYEE
jgi:hypothetical protein